MQFALESDFKLYLFTVGYRTVVFCSSVQFHLATFSFFLPGHEADWFFKGNRVLLQCTQTVDNPLTAFRRYLTTCDTCFPLKPELWLRLDGRVPTHAWFLCRLHRHFSYNVAGHSLRSGDATALVQAGMAPHLIQAIGHWASDTFQIYIREHPVLLTVMLCLPTSSL
jgi:hypothetical protein